MEELFKYLFIPSNVLTILLLTTAVLFILKKYSLSNYLLILTAVCYLLLGFGPVAHYLLSSLEYKYEAYKECHDLQDTCDIKYIVILTGDGEIKPGIPSSSILNSSSLYRLVEARRIINVHNNSVIYISGTIDVSKMMKQVLMSMGVEAEKIIIDSHAESTFHSAMNLKPVLVNQNFILVTSAGHMYRSMSVFESQNLLPIAAPTDFLSQQNPFAAQYLPTSHHIYLSELAIFEYSAIYWYRLTNKINKN